MKSYGEWGQNDRWHFPGSKFKVTNLVLVKDEELTVAYMDFSIDLTRTVQTPHALLVLAPQLLFRNVTVFLG